MDESAPLLDNTQNHEIEIIDIQAGTTSSRSTLLNLLNLLLGIGLLSLPFAFSTLGWILSLVLLTVFCALSCYTTCMIASFHTKSLDSVAKDAFGRNGGICVSVLICMELTAAAVAMTILVADSVVAMIGSSGGWDTKHIKIAFAVLATPTCLLGMGKLSWMSAVGILCFANLMLIVVGDGALGVEGACWYKPQETVLYFTDFKQAAMAVGLLFVGLDCTFS